MNISISKLIRLVCLTISAMIFLTLFVGCGNQTIKPADDGKTAAASTVTQWGSVK